MQVRNSTVIIAWLIGLATVLNATAGETDENYCTPVRLDSAGFSMEHVLTSNQRSSGTCYAFTSAEILDAWRFSHEATHFDLRTYPLDLATLESDAEKKTRVDGGRVDKTLALAVAQGVCTVPAKELESENINPDFAELFDNFHNASPTNTSEKKFESFLAVSNRMSELTTSPLPTLRQIQDDLNVDSQIEFLKRILAPVCRGPRLELKSKPTVNRMVIENTSQAERQRIADRIHGILDFGLRAQPAALTICSGVLSNSTGYAHLGFDANDGKWKCSGLDESHSVLVIGRRRGHHGRCQFLIQNSWGAKPTGVNFPPWQIDGGKIWIDEWAVIQNTIDVINLE